ncbi:MAG: hypothetical protein JNM56_40590 [Planctomycetia bacterium]|nr:hypothetical protein [Planctomycetia bacterium]
MKRTWHLVLLAFGLAAFSGALPNLSAQDKKGEVVTIDGLKAAVPAEWKDEKPANRMRFVQFKLPKVKDDKVDAELVVFKGLGGSAEQNIARWKAMFVPPQGKTIDEVSKVAEIKIGKEKAAYLDVSGTYKFKEAPFDPKSKEELKPGYRMLNIHYEGKDDPYQFRLVGPAATVEHYKKGFEDWIQALK